MPVQNLNPGAVKNVAANEIHNHVHVYRTNQGQPGGGHVGWLPNGGVLQSQPLAVSDTVTFIIGRQAGMIANGCPSVVQLLWDNDHALAFEPAADITADDVLHHKPTRE